MVRALVFGLLACALIQIAPHTVSAAEGSDAWDDVKAYTVEKKQAAVAYGKNLVRETDTKIEELEAQAAKASGEAKAAQERSIKELKAKRAQTVAKLDDMGEASGDAWDATKRGFADAYKDLSQSYNKAIDYFKK